MEGLMTKPKITRRGRHRLGHTVQKSFREGLHFEFPISRIIITENISLKFTYQSHTRASHEVLFVCLGFNGTYFSTNRLYRAITVG